MAEKERESGDVRVKDDKLVYYYSLKNVKKKLLCKTNIHDCMVKISLYLLSIDFKKNVVLLHNYNLRVKRYVETILVNILILIYLKPQYGQI